MDLDAVTNSALAHVRTTTRNVVGSRSFVIGSGDLSPVVGLTQPPTYPDASPQVHRSRLVMPEALLRPGDYTRLHRSRNNDVGSKWLSINWTRFQGIGSRRADGSIAGGGVQRRESTAKGEQAQQRAQKNEERRSSSGNHPDRLGGLAFMSPFSLLHRFVTDDGTRLPEAPAGRFDRMPSRRRRARSPSSLIDAEERCGAA